jgi:arylformamidase
MTDWRRDFGLPPDTIKSGLCCSATYDFRSLRLSSAGAGLVLTDAAEEELSPMRHVDRIAAPLLVAVGSLETPLFLDESRRFATAVERAGKSARFLIAEGYNHFEVIETLASPYAVLGRTMLQLMRLSPA